MSDAALEQNEIQIKPGKNLYSISLDNIECVFEANVQGGTGEKWYIKIGINDKETVCQINRNSETYLVFQNFKLKMNGKTPDNAMLMHKGLVLDGQFIFSKQDGSVKESPIFKSRLTTIVLGALKENKNEL
ncbi:unnamed protein product [Gordionus sp. m RMFG-2023]